VLALGASSFPACSPLCSPFSHLQKLAFGFPVFLFLSLLSAAPFFAFERYIYTLYCLPDSTQWRPWCDSTFGLSYGWIQREYWCVFSSSLLPYALNSVLFRRNVRPFAYWTLLQVPNFLLAFPVLALSFYSSYTFYRTHFSAVVSTTLPFLPSSLQPYLTKVHPSTLAQIPFNHLSTALTLLLLTTAHVQIALRVCVCDPTIFWAAAKLVEEDFPLLFSSSEGVEGAGEHYGGTEGRSAEGATVGRKTRARWRWGELWIRYCLVWGTVATVLYGAWLPPA
jgi:phosphatidylinositol glycan class V